MLVAEDVLATSEAASTLRRHQETAMKNIGLDMGLKIRAIGAPLTALACLVFASGCGSQASGGGETEKPSEKDTGVLRGTIGASGGELIGEVGSALEGVRLQVPAGALAKDTVIEIRPSSASATTPLPKTAVECGPEFEISPHDLVLAQPATVTLPFDEATVTTNYRFDDEVKAWLLDGDKWSQRLQ